MTQLAVRTARISRQTSPALGANLEAGVTRNTLLFLLAHIPLALLIQRLPVISTIYAYATLLVGLSFLIRDKNPIRVIYFVTYIVGAEVLWRGTGAAIFWEIGKYTMIVFFLLLMLKERDFSKFSKIPFFYFLLLVPSVLQAIDWNSFRPSIASQLTFFDLISYRLGIQREYIAFHLAGPLSLTIAASYLSSYKLTKSQLRNLFTVFLGPAIALLFLAIVGTVQAGTAVLETLFSSTRVTAAGIGPNQVSSLLGLAATISFLLIFVLDQHIFLKLVAVTLSMAFLGQALLTFSRGGVYNALGAMIVASIFLFRERRARLDLVISWALLSVVLAVALFPMLDRITGGGLSSRFESGDDSGRGRLVANQLDSFVESPIFGQGVGQVTFRGHTSHNEYTRTLGEHGIVGALGLVIIVFVAADKFLSERSPLQRALSAGFFVWTFLYFGYTGTRLAAPAWAFGIATLSIVMQPNMLVDETTDPATE